ncbi:MAG: 2-amino-4-hydroxy-6-hydroxymethyldihydropteridine diphosphokinase [Barnesiella sp.]|nr:2-amino-4-hydroxy-6-hydroxymethyldihydropteridine diphosphokinase [Barnesiella sp.]
MATAHINIGSNIGDRHAAISMAVAAIEAHFGVKARVSDPVVSPPWGFESSNEFVNVGVNVDVGELDPLDLLSVLLELQQSISPAPHRDHAGGYIDRVIDIDLIAVGEAIVSSPELELPHPRMAQRLFVLRPMAQIWPEWHHPRSGLTPSELIDALRRE